MVAVQVSDQRGRPRRHLGGKAIGVGLLEDMFVVADLVLVAGAFAQPRNEDLPEAAGDMLPHGMAAAVPGVEVADHAHAGGVRGPDGEVHPVHAVDGPQLRPEPGIALPMPAFVEQVTVVIGQQRREGVWVVHGDDSLSPIFRQTDLVTEPLVVFRHRTDGLVQSGRMNPPHRPGRPLMGHIDHPSLARLRQEGPDRQRPAARVVHFVRTQ